ncbi:hypothetical protein HOC_19906 [Hyphomonas oceanitis SCH89]|uniref:Uncharacterized protein n=1 Tax=Hyphomonas oceanitis SCH89 TaxID=1280953 RepID=A0A059G1Y1_9PROT|nr:hypothetical protein HOC_19906 [Hyphomonas oceanitis SCH89]
MPKRAASTKSIICRAIIYLTNKTEFISETLMTANLQFVRQQNTSQMLMAAITAHAPVTLDSIK